MHVEVMDLWKVIGASATPIITPKLDPTNAKRDLPLFLGASKIASISSNSPQI